MPLLLFSFLGFETTSSALEVSDDTGVEVSEFEASSPEGFLLPLQAENVINIKTANIKTANLFKFLIIFQLLFKVYCNYTFLIINCQLTNYNEIVTFQ